MKRVRVVRFFSLFLLFVIFLAFVQTIYFGSLTGYIVAENVSGAGTISLIFIGLGLLLVAYLLVKTYHWTISNGVWHELR